MFRVSRPGHAIGEESEVDVAFAKTANGTRITIVQTGWEDLPSDHPVRHGLDEDAFNTMLAVFWGDLLSSARVFAAEAIVR